MTVRTYKRILVTGGSGRLGRYVVDELLPHYQVTVLDRLPPTQDVPFIEANIEDRDALAGAFTNMDAVIQLAALDLGTDAAENLFFQVNVQGLWNVLEFAEAAKVQRTVVCSSITAMELNRAQPPKYLPVDTHHPAAPAHAYAISKLAGEVIAEAFSRRSAMEVLCLRPAYIVRDASVYSLAQLIATADNTQLPPPMTDPSWEPQRKERPGSRSFISPGDAARCFRAALEAQVTEFEIFNVTAADTYSALDTLDVVRREFGSAPEVRDPDLYAHDPRASIYDISRTRDVLGWEPRERWADVMARVVSSKKSQKPVFSEPPD